MTMFWTAFIWGFGAATGGSIGLMSFVVLYSVWRVMTQTKTAKNLSEYHEAANAALERRNELTEVMIEHLATMASKIDKAKIGQGES